MAYSFWYDEINLGWDFVDQWATGYSFQINIENALS